MPQDWLGQMVTFAAEVDPDAHYSRYVWVRARGKNDTIHAIAARRGHPELAAEILKLNKGADVLPHPKRKPHQKAPPIPRLRTIKQKLRPNAPIRLPGTMKTGEFLSVHAGDQAPTVKAGYAKYDTVDVPGRLGISRFLGYDPIALDIPIQFEGYTVPGAGVAIERDIQILERLAGRGDYPGAALGPPAVVRISVTDSHGNVLPLIPPDYQWSAQHQHAPLFRISGISWDQGALRTISGYRLRQSAVITATQYTPLVFVQRSVAQRTATIPSKTSKAKR